MNKTLITIVAAVALTFGSAFAHDPSKHKGKPVQGEVVSLAGDRFEVKTAAGIIPVTFSSKTKFEHGDATVDKTHVTKGAHVSVFGTKLPSGVMVAREVLIGTLGNEKDGRATKAGTSGGAKKEIRKEHKHWDDWPVVGGDSGYMHRCGFGDLAIVAVVYSLVALINWEWRWGLAPNRTDYLMAALIGASAANTLEKIAITHGWWSYTDAMPRMPGTDIGLLPLLQLSVLVPLTLAGSHVWYLYSRWGDR